MTTRRGLFGLFAGALIAPAVAKALPEPKPVLRRIGDPYAFTPRVTGKYEPYTFTITGLPDGCTFDRKTGIVTGTPR